MSDTERAPTIWVVMHPEHRIQIEVAARTNEEAHRAAWGHWYRRPVRDGLDELMRDAFQVRNTGKPYTYAPTCPVEPEDGPRKPGAGRV